MKKGLKELTAKQQLFIAHYLIKPDAKHAAIAAGYKQDNAGVQGHKLLNNPDVAAQLKLKQKALYDKLEIESQDAIVQLYYTLTRNAGDFCDETGKIITNVNDLNERARACIDGIDQDVRIIYNDDGSIAAENIKTKLKITPKLPAIELAMKHKGMFETDSSKDKVEKLNWDGMFDDGRNDPDEIEDQLK